MKSNLALLGVIALFGSVLAHSTIYPELEGKVDCNPNSTSPPSIQSYHIHVLYWASNNNTKETAHNVKENFKRHFNASLGPDCHQLVHNDHNCMLDEAEGPAGPFVVAQWSAFILP